MSHIAALIDDHSFACEWEFVGFYGDPVMNNRHRSWCLLNQVMTTASEAALVMGDFNDIISSSEKRGGSHQPPKQMADFKDTISTCGLIDLGYQEYKYTWRRGHSLYGGVEE